MAVYQYHLYDHPSRTLIDTLPIEQVTFGVELRGVGVFTGSIPLYGDDLDAERVMAATIPHRTKIFVERDGTLVWGGRIIPPRDYDSSTGRITINAEETVGAFANRYLPNLSWYGVDQFDIFRGIVTTLQSDVGGDLGLVLGAEMSGVLRDRNYLLGDQTVGLDALTNLSEVINGFDWATQVVWDENNDPQERIVLFYPRMGRVGNQSGLVLEHDRFTGGGNVAHYTWSDGPGLFTRSWATTETEEGVQLVASKTNTDLIAAGYPLLEQSQSYDGIVILQTLQDHADALSAYASGHRVTAELTVKASDGLELGNWQMGDEALVRVSDWRFPADPVTGAPGFAGYLRVVGWEVTPDADGIEEYTFTMADFLEGL